MFYVLLLPLHFNSVLFYQLHDFAVHVQGQWQPLMVESLNHISLLQKPHEMFYVLLLHLHFVSILFHQPHDVAVDVWGQPQAPLGDNPY